jgi:hypothetical protein
LINSSKLSAILQISGECRLTDWETHNAEARLFAVGSGGSGHLVQEQHDSGLAF